VQFHLVPTSKGDWPAYGADFGKVSTKKMTIFGYKLHLLITMNGLILDFELIPASASDLTVGHELLSEHTDLEVIGDKGYIDAFRAAELIGQMGTLDVIEPIRNYVFKNDLIREKVEAGLALIHERNFTTECPFCAEIIKARAIVCKHCGKDVVAKQ
jgi:hypothetical protein